MYFVDHLVGIQKLDPRTLTKKSNPFFKILLADPLDDRPEDYFGD